MPKVIVHGAVQVNGRILVPGLQDLDQSDIDLLKSRKRGHLFSAVKMSKKNDPEKSGESGESGESQDNENAPTTEL